MTGQNGHAGESPAATGSLIFRDVTSEAGIEFRHQSGGTGLMHVAEITGSGAALFDYDNDGDMDLYLVQGGGLPGAPDRLRLLDQLYRNNLEDGKLSFTNVTATSGIEGDGYGIGVAAGDFDNDGWTDLYVANLGPNQLLRNNGNGPFSDVTEKSGTGDGSFGSSVAFFDYDRDGWLDLFVANYVVYSYENSPRCYAPSSRRDYCGPKSYAAAPDRLYRNRGNGTFEDVTHEAGLDREYGPGLGVVAADLDLDGWLDLYVANDGEANQLWMNQKNGTFVNAALLAGVALNRMGAAEAGMGVDAADFDRDGDEDFFIAHLTGETNTLYVNSGDGLFEDRSLESRLGTPSFPYTGFGAGWIDYDNDGWLDIVVLNGAVRIVEENVRRGLENSMVQPNQLFRNQGNGLFEEITGAPVRDLAVPEVSRGAAFGDVDQDGDIDLVVMNNDGPARLLINESAAGNTWLGLRLVEKHGRDALGALVDLEVEGEPRLMRRARADGSFCSARDPRVILGLGSGKKVRSLRVDWPDGTSEFWPSLPLNRYHEIRQGAAPQGQP